MKTLFILFIMTLFMNLTVYAQVPTLRTIDNSFNVTALEQNFINANDTTLFPVREIINNFGYEIDWNEETYVATITKDDFKSYVTEYAIYQNRIFLSLSDILQHIETPLYFSSELNVIYGNKNLNESTLKSLMPSYNGYTKDDLDWMSKIVSAEARGEDFSSQVDVANVIINRVHASQYPNTIYSVIFDNRNGVQFSPTINGQIYKEPTLSSYLAALETLDNTSFATTKNQNALFFINPTIATSSWVHRNRTFAFASGNHNFYY